MNRQAKDVQEFLRKFPTPHLKSHGSYATKAVVVLFHPEEDAEAPSYSTSVHWVNCQDGETEVVEILQSGLSTARGDSPYICTDND